MFSLFNAGNTLPRITFLYKKIITDKCLNQHFEFYNGYYNLNLGYITNKYVPFMKDTGCYIIMIETDYDSKTNPKIFLPFNGIFCLCRSQKHTSGVVNPMCTTNDSRDGFIDIEWKEFEYPSLILKWYSNDSYYKLVDYIKYNQFEISMRITILN